MKCVEMNKKFNCFFGFFFMLLFYLFIFCKFFATEKLDCPSLCSSVWKCKRLLRIALVERY